MKLYSLTYMIGGDDDFGEVVEYLKGKGCEFNTDQAEIGVVRVGHPSDNVMGRASRSYKHLELPGNNGGDQRSKIFLKPKIFLDAYADTRLTELLANYAKGDR